MSKPIYLKIEFEQKSIGFKEIIEIDKNEMQIKMKQSFASGKEITQLHQLKDNLKGLMRLAQICLSSKEWEEYDSDEADDIIIVDAVYNDGQNVVKKSAYKRNAMPEHRWIEFLTLLRQLIAPYSECEMFNLNRFMRARKKGELIYCSIAVGDCSKDYYYLSDDDTIGLGDEVMVPFGRLNNVCVGEVVSVEYCSPNLVPYPVCCTKKIISKLSNKCLC